MSGYAYFYLSIRPLNSSCNLNDLLAVAFICFIPRFLNRELHQFYCISKVQAIRGTFMSQTVKATSKLLKISCKK